jgi:hypothetical protein
MTKEMVAEAKRRYPRDPGDEMAFRQGAEEWIANDGPTAPEGV